MGSSPTCAVPACDEPRFAGEDFCLRHGPEKRTAASKPAASSVSQVLCPHCQVRGHVTRETVKVKRGLSGGKVTGAVFTAGISMLGTGLSRKQEVTELHCSNCDTTWHVE